ncbi:MAG: membrane-bound O-acyltransferase family protein [Fluviicola sp.]|nr:MAG: membrane-bound O-acyltransferase family protein [Fluviicola sp.]
MDWFYNIFPIERFTDIFSTEIGYGNKLVFTEFNFWLFFILVLVIFSFLRKNKLARSVFLTIVSLYIYFKTSGLFLLVLLISIIVNYFFGRRIFAARSDLRRKWIIAFSAIFNLLILGYFKYAIFFTESFNEVFHTNYESVNHFIQYGQAWVGEEWFAKPAPSLASQFILPVGVSFFTFQNISYTVDIYRKEITPVKNFFHYTFFVSFFPQLVMGPIVRARDFIPQISQPFVLKRDDFSWSIIQIVKGLVKKIVIADFLVVHFINRITEDPSAYPGFVSVLAMWAYSLHIYADFSGYTDIAIGLSRLMGFELKENFNSPYKAINVADFWRRWHKSLGSWLRDYLYIPLGGNRGGSIGSYIAILIIFVFLIFITGWYDLLYVYAGLTVLYIIGLFVFKDFKRYVHRDLNLLITMVIGGLWHGASENFVIWGAMNGCALIIYKYWKQISPYENKSNFFVHFWKIFITFNFITFTRIWFKLEDDGLPNVMLNQMWNHFNLTWETFVTILTTYQAVFWVMLGGFFIHWLPEKFKKMYERWFTRMPLTLQAISVAVIIVLMYQAISSEAPPFVYLMF